MKGVGQRVGDEIGDDLSQRTGIAFHRDHLGHVTHQHIAALFIHRQQCRQHALQRLLQVEAATLAAGLVGRHLLEGGDQLTGAGQIARQNLAALVHRVEVLDDGGALDTAGFHRLDHIARQVLQGTGDGDAVPIGVFNSCAMPATSEPSAAIFSERASSPLVRVSDSIALASSVLACSSLTVRERTRDSSCWLTSRISCSIWRWRVMSTMEKISVASPRNSNGRPDNRQVSTRPVLVRWRTSSRSTTCCCASCSSMRTRSSGSVHRSNSVEVWPITSSRPYSNCVSQKSLTSTKRPSLMRTMPSGIGVSWKMLENLRSLSTSSSS